MARVLKLRMLQPLRHRDFRLLWTGMTVSLLGDGVFLIAVAWQVYELSSAPAALASVGLAMAVPQVVLLLVGGVVSDRFDRRRVMVASDVVRGLAVAAIAILTLTGTLTLGATMALVAVFGAATAFFGPAFDAIVPEVVPAEELNEANSLDQFVRPAAQRLAGPALGGLVIAGLGTGWAFALDAASFAISAGCVLRMRPHATVRDPAATSALQDVREGVRFVRSRVWLWGTFLGATISYLLFMGPSEVLLPYVVKEDMEASAGVLGIVFAMGGVGALSAAAIVGQRDVPRRHMTAIYAAWAAATLSIAGYGLAVAPWQIMLACLAFNALEAAGTVWWTTTKQRLVPGEMLGRVSSVDWFVSTALVPLSYALTGPLAAGFGAQTTLVIAGGVGAVTTLAFLFLPGMRTQSA